MELLNIGELIKKEGLRIALVEGVPSPWSQATKAMIEYKGLDYTAGYFVGGGANEQLVAWSGVNSAPIADSDEAGHVFRAKAATDSEACRAGMTR